VEILVLTETFDSLLSSLRLKYIIFNLTEINYYESYPLCELLIFPSETKYSNNKLVAKVNTKAQT
jgi:hypothetical protein